MSEHGDIEGERNVSPVASGRRGWTVLQKTAVFGLGVGAIVAAVFWRDAAKPVKEAQAAPVSMGQSMPFERFIPPIAAPAAWVPSQFIPPITPPRTLPDVLQQQAQQPAQARKRMLSFASTAATAPKSEPAAARQPEPNDERTGVAFKASRIPGGKAGPAMDLTYMLMPGVIKCTLQNAIDTTQPGPIFCETSEDVFSPAHVKLMEAHTKIVGSYGANMQQGQNRFPAVSAYAITPNGVPIALAGPMGDALGRSGMAGEVDNHTGSRFGGALLLLASQGAISVAQSAVQRSNTSSLNLQTGGVESAITETLRNTVNIPPTVRVNQGSEVAILVTQATDFRDAYVLRTTP